MNYEEVDPGSQCDRDGCTNQVATYMRHSCDRASDPEVVALCQKCTMAFVAPFVLSCLHENALQLTAMLNGDQETAAKIMVTIASAIEAGNGDLLWVSLDELANEFAPMIRHLDALHEEATTRRRDHREGYGDLPGQYL